MILTAKESGNFIPHPPGIWPAVCVDLVDLGLVESDWQGVKSLKPKLKLVFETGQLAPDGTLLTVSKNFTVSLNQTANLTKFLGSWRGKPVLPGENIDLSKLIGASCTLVVSHKQNLQGRIYASLDAVSKPTAKVVPSGKYDGPALRARIADWKAKASATPGNLNGGQKVATPPANVPPAAAPPAPMPPDDDVPF